jgi:hypothetical protein
MFVALLISGTLALAGLAGGIIGMVMVGLFLVSITVFFWELVLRADDLQIDVSASQQAYARRRDRKAAVESDWITDYDWIGEQAHRDQRYYGQTDYVYASPHVFTEPDTTPLRKVTGRLPTRPRNRTAA